MSLTPEEIRNLIESRKVEALIKKIPEKIDLVLFVYGHDVTGDLGASEYENYLTTTPYEAQEGNSYLYARKFDGLGTGFPIEILRTEHLGETVLSWNGKQVFSQFENQITSFIPSSPKVETPWEDVLELFYNKALKHEKGIKKDIKEEEKIEMRSRLNKVVEFLKNTWGIG